MLDIPFAGTILGALANLKRRVICRLPCRENLVAKSHRFLAAQRFQTNKKFQKNIIRLNWSAANLVSACENFFGGGLGPLVWEEIETLTNSSKPKCIFIKDLPST
jgi:hypothetical protein